MKRARVFAAALAVTALMGISVPASAMTTLNISSQANAVCSQMIMDENAVAYITDKGGRIDIINPYFWNQNGVLTEIAGTPLSEIIRIKTAYVKSIEDVFGHGLLYDHTVYARGKGKLSLRFTDETGDYYDLDIDDYVWEDNHFVWYNSAAPRITRIEWMDGTTGWSEIIGG